MSTFNTVHMKSIINESVTNLNNNYDKIYKIFSKQDKIKTDKKSKKQSKEKTTNLDQPTNNQKSNIINNMPLFGYGTNMSKYYLPITINSVQDNDRVQNTSKNIELESKQSSLTPVLDTASEDDNAVKYIYPMPSPISQALLATLIGGLK